MIQWQMIRSLTAAAPGNFLSSFNKAMALTFEPEFLVLRTQLEASRATPMMLNGDGQECPSDDSACDFRGFGEILEVARCDRGKLSRIAGGIGCC